MCICWPYTYSPVYSASSTTANSFIFSHSCCISVSHLLLQITATGQSSTVTHFSTSKARMATTPTCCSPLNSYAHRPCTWCCLPQVAYATASWYLFSLQSSACCASDAQSIYGCLIFLNENELQLYKPSHESITLLA